MTQNNNKPIHTIEYYNEEKRKIYFEEWKLDGKLHREDGPAYIKYYADENIWSKHYCINGKYHREDGAAFICYNEDGSIRYLEYDLNGKRYSSLEYLKLIPPQNRIKVLLND